MASEQGKQAAGGDGILEITRKLDEITKGQAGLRTKFTEAIDSINRRLDGMDQRFDDMGQRLDGMDQRFDGMGQRLDGMERRLDGMERRFDDMERRLDGMERRLDGMERRFDDMDQRLDYVDRSLDVLNERITLNEMRTDEALIGRRSELDRDKAQHGSYGAMQVRGGGGLPSTPMENRFKGGGGRRRPAPPYSF